MSRPYELVYLMKGAGSRVAFRVGLAVLLKRGYIGDYVAEYYRAC